MKSTPQDGTSYGGLAIVFLCFFAIGFLATLLVEFLIDSYWQSSKLRSPEFSELLAETSGEKILEPEPRFGPEQVVSYQLEKLSLAQWATGIRQCFAFASPSNKQMTGPIERFSQMVQSPPYSALISPQELLIGKSEIDENHASVTVTLLDSHGEVHAFQFLLIRQTEGEYSGCWMTESVFQLQRSDAGEPEKTPSVSHPVAPSFRSRELDSHGAISKA